MLQEDLLKILPMINEANAMSEELDKKVCNTQMIFNPVQKIFFDCRVSAMESCKKAVTICVK